MNRLLSVVVVSLALLAGALFFLTGSSPRGSSSARGSNEPIVLFCAASNRAVMELIRADYEREFDRQVQIQYGPSQTLLSSIEVSGTGDLYLPADDGFLEIAASKSLIAEVIPVAMMKPVLAVRKGNPKSINTLDDLLSDEVRFVQADPESAAIGRIVRDVLQQSGQWDKIAGASVAYRTTVSDVANDIIVGAADCGFVYDAMLNDYPALDSIKLSQFDGVTSQVSMGVIASTKQPQSALHFARYVSARDRGLKHYIDKGFEVTQGDVWQDTPELVFFAGSMLRPAIEDTIIEFEKREAVRVSRVYNGCGILVAQMKAGQHPDAYFACDSEFMKQVPDLFPEPVNVSQNELVILVQKGNPKKIGTLKDLGREGLRVGVGHEKQCAMGWLTQNTFREGGVEKEVMANVTVQTPSGDMLVNQMQTGSLDAAVAYLSNAAGAAEFLDAIQIQGLSCSVATQPLAIAPNSFNYQIASRLLEALFSAESQATFEAEGFRWQLER